MMNQSAQAQLQQNVLDAGACSLCGACSGICPYLEPYQGRVAVVDRCSLLVGRCLSFCPRAGTDLDKMHRSLFDADYSGEPLGTVRRVLMTRSNAPDVRKAAQYGGTVTTLVRHALDRGMVQRAILTQTVEGTPRGVSVTSAEEVLKCAGSNYLASPTLAALNRDNGGYNGAVAFVGTPCQVNGFRKIIASPLGTGNGNRARSIALGLFCTWALGRSFLDLLQEKVPAGQIRKTDVPPPPAQQFDIETQNERVSLPLDDVRPHILDACATCHDMTAEFADVSVGSAEGIPGWNTLLVRTQRGEELVQQALDQGKLEAQELPTENLKHLQQAASNKRVRAFKRLSEESGSMDDLGYLRLNVQAARRIMQGA